MKRTMLIVGFALVGACKKADAPKAPARAEAPSSVGIKTEPIVKSVEAQYFEKDDLKAEQGRFRAQVKNGETEVDGKVRVAIHKPGADKDESKALSEAWAGTDVPIAPGTYDVFIKYKESDVARAHGWLRGVVVKGKNLLRARVVLDYPVGRVRYSVTNAGQSVDGKTRIVFFKPGADAQESKPLAEIWSGEEIVLPAGKYDVLVRYTESDQAREEKWLRGVDVPGGHQLKKETVVLETPVGFVKLTATNNGADVNGQCRYHIWKAGADAKETGPLAEGWAGSYISLPGGTYDVRVDFKASDYAKRDEWVKGLVVEGKREKKVQEIKFALELAKLKVDVAEGEKPANDKGRIMLYVAGKSGADDQPIAEVWAGTSLVVPAGSYDLAARFTPAGGGAPKMKWEKGLALKGGDPVEKKIAF